MADLGDRDVLSVLTEYHDDCVLFQTLLDIDCGRELAEHLIVLWMHMKTVQMPDPMFEEMVPVVTEIPSVEPASYLEDFVKKSRMALSLMQIPTPPLPSDAPVHLNIFGWPELAKYTIMDMAAEYDSGIPILIFDDMLRTTYLYEDGDISLLHSPAAEIATVPKVMESERSLQFAYPLEYGQEFESQMVDHIESDILDDGCVERVVINPGGNGERIVGLIVFKAPASYLQYVFSLDYGRITCADGSHFFLRLHLEM